MGKAVLVITIATSEKDDGRGEVRFAGESIGTWRTPWRSAARELICLGYGRPNDLLVMVRESGEVVRSGCLGVAAGISRRAYHAPEPSFMWLSLVD